MSHIRRTVLGTLLLGVFALSMGMRAALADPPPARVGGEERWIGLRVNDPDLRLRAVLDTKGPLNEVANAIPFLVIALDDESPPVQAAARERLRALADEAVTPILDALQAARPGRKAGAFGALSALGTTVTPVEIAVAAGGMAPVNPPDRREAALMLALPTATPAAGPRSKMSASLRLATLLLADGDAQVRRAAAAASALIGLLHIGTTEIALTRVPHARSPRIVLSQGQRERLVELMAHGSADIAVAAAGLAGRFGDASEPVLGALIGLLEKDDRRDAAAFALADLGAESAVPHLARHATSGTWRALLRLGGDEVVLKALKSPDRLRRRLAASVAVAEWKGGPEAVEAMLPELAEALEDGRFADVRPWLRRIGWLNSQAQPALPLLQAFVEKSDGDLHAKDLAAAVAFGIDRTQAWAAKRVEGLLAQGDVNPPAPLDPQLELAVSTALAATYWQPGNHPAEVPLALTPRRMLGLTLTDEVVIMPLALSLLREKPPGPLHLPLLLSVFGEPGSAAYPHGGVPTLKDFTERGLLADETVVTRRLALHVLMLVPAVTAEHRRLVEALTSARDPWLRHVAARVLRTRWPA